MQEDVRHDAVDRTEACLALVVVGAKPAAECGAVICGATDRGVDEARLL